MCGGFWMSKISSWQIMGQLVQAISDEHGRVQGF